MAEQKIPAARAPLTEPGGIINREWYRFLMSLVNGGGDTSLTIQGADGVPVAQESVLEFGQDFEVVPATGKTVVNSKGPQIKKEGHRWADIHDNGISLTKIKEVITYNNHWWDDKNIEAGYLWWDDADFKHHMIYPAYTSNIPIAIQIPDWQPNHNYVTVGEKINSDGSIWEVKTAGTSNITSGPTGLVEVVDPTNTLVWAYISPYKRSVFGHATSVNLVDWTVDTEPLFEGDTSTLFDTAGVTGGLMLKYDGTYYLYYIGLTEPGYEQGLTTTCLATASTLSGPWTRLGTVVGLGRRYSNYPSEDTSYHADGIADVTAWRCMDVWGFDTVINVDGLWYAFFNGTGYAAPVTGQTGARETIGYATSTDLETWIVQDSDSPVFWGTLGSEFDWIIGENAIYWDGDKWVMHFYGANTIHPESPIQNGICYTTRESFPGGWSQPTYSPTLTCTPGGYDDTQAAKPGIYRYGGKLYHFYGTQSGTLFNPDNVTSIALAVPSTEVWKYQYVTDGLLQETVVPNDSNVVVHRLKSQTGVTSEETFDSARGVRLIDGKDITTRYTSLDPFVGKNVSDSVDIDVRSSGDSSVTTYGARTALTKFDGYDSLGTIANIVSNAKFGAGTSTLDSGHYNEYWVYHPGAVVTTRHSIESVVTVRRGAEVTTLHHFRPTTNLQADFAGSYTTDATGYAIGETVINVTGSGSVSWGNYISFPVDPNWYMVSSLSGGILTLVDPLLVAIPASATSVVFPTGASIGTEVAFYCPTLSGTTKYALYSSSSTVPSYHAGNFTCGATVDAAAFKINGVAFNPGDSNAIHYNAADEYDSAANKATLALADRLLIEDTAAGYAKKYCNFTSIRDLFNADFGTIAGENWTGAHDWTTAGTTVKFLSIDIDGQATRYISSARNTTSNTAGSQLIISAGGATSGATDKPGGTMLTQPGVSTGTGVATNSLGRYSRAVTSGTTDNTWESCFESGTQTHLTSGAATNLFREDTVPALGGGGGRIMFSIFATDGTDVISYSGHVDYNLCRKSTGAAYNSFTQVLSDPARSNAGHSISLAWGILSTSPGANNTPVIQLTPTATGITPTSFYIRYSVIRNKTGYLVHY